MGSFAQQIYQRDEKAKGDQLQFQIAPLAQALRADQTRLALYADPNDPSKAVAGKEQEYQTTLSNMTNTIGQMRSLLGQREPHHSILDSLHIRRDLQNRVTGWNQKNQEMAGQYAQGGIPYEMTPEGQAEAYQRQTQENLQKLRNEGGASTYHNFRLPDGKIITIDTKHQAIPAGAVMVGAETAQAKPIKGTMVRSKQSPTGFAQTWVSATDPNKIVAWQPISPSRWYIGFQTQSTTTDPFGVTSSTSHVMSPAESGFVDLTGAQQMPAESGDVSVPAPIPPSTPPKTASKGKTAKPISSTKLNGKSPALDSQGHIPAESGINPMVRSAANQLLDGMDIDKLPLPARDKQMAATVAARYGWGQGLFTPKEKLLINEAATKLDAMKNAPSLRVLDITESRLKLAAILHASQGKPGLMASAIASVAAGHLTPDEQDFLRRYNATVGVISGLGPLTRGKAATEATINRLMLELPSVLQSGSASDAKQRIDQLLQEIKVAESTKGNTGLGVNNNSDPLGILQ